MVTLLKDRKAKTRFTGLKRWLCATVLGLSLNGLAHAQSSVSLGWDGSTDTNVTGYVLAYGLQSGNYSTQVDAGTNLMAAASNLAASTTYYFVVTAYDASGNLGLPSSEVYFTTTNTPTTITTDPTNPTNSNPAPGTLQLKMAGDAAGSAIVSFTIATGHWYSLQASGDLKSWATIWQVSTATPTMTVSYTDTPPADVTYAQRFYRYVQN